MYRLRSVARLRSNLQFKIPNGLAAGAWAAAAESAPFSASSALKGNAKGLRGGSPSARADFFQLEAHQWRERETVFEAFDGALDLHHGVQDWVMCSIEPCLDSVS